MDYKVGNDKGSKIVKVIIDTTEDVIRGEMTLPNTFEFKDYTDEDLLFCFLNSGIKFIKIANSVVTSLKDREFRPKEYSTYIVNVDIIKSAYIPEE